MSELIKGRRTDNTIGRVQPITVEEMMAKSGLTRAEVEDRFQRFFGSWESYRDLCLNDPKELADRLEELGAYW